MYDTIAGASINIQSVPQVTATGVGPLCICTSLSTDIDTKGTLINI